MKVAAAAAAWPLAVEAALPAVADSLAVMRETCTFVWGMKEESFEGDRAEG